MTGAVALAPLFLLACACGYILARPGVEPDGPVWRAGIGGIAAILLVGASIAAAEAGSAMARYMALFALLSASAGAVMIMGVVERRWPPIDGDALDPVGEGDDG